MKVKDLIKQIEEKVAKRQVFTAISLNRKYLPWAFAWLGVCFLLVWRILER